MKGNVKWFNDSKGYGFISPEGGGADIFVHFSGIIGEGRRTLCEGDSVTFEKIQGERGPQATDVQVQAQ